MKNKKGITLIALIITIIVLLILAGVSISILTGDNGVLSQAQESKEKTDKAHIQEMRDLTVARAAMNLEGYTDEKTGVYIPSGFAVSENPEEQTVAKGLVIIDKMGDEFVWVPVNNASDFVKRAGKNGYHVTETGAQTSPDVSGLKDNYGNNPWLETAENATVSEIDSIMNKEKNYVVNAGGFFISRYEIGLDGNIQRTLMESDNINYYENTSDSSIDKDTKYWKDARETDGANSTAKRQAIIDRILPQLQSKQGLEPARKMTQDECLWLANSWKSGKDHQSGLVTGRTWDTALNFAIGGYANADNNCQEWGNYYNSASITYKKIFHSGNTNGKWLDESNYSKSLSTSIVFQTGEFVNSTNLNTTAKNNIYDMAGNVWEWTTEVPFNSTKRVLRGGGAANNGDSYPATCRNGDDSGTTRNNWHVGFRSVLYVIK